MPSPMHPASTDDANAKDELREAQAALEAATRACDDALRAWHASPARWDRRALDEAARGFIAAQRRLSLAQAAARRRGAEKAWGGH